MTELGKTLRAIATPIPGLTVWELPVHGDNRGWFKETWQRAKMVAAGMPDFGPVQNNISFNESAGTTRGIHAEPWDKFVSVATGRIFGAWVDMRSGPTFGTVFTIELDPSRAVFVPRGVGNSFQTLEPNTVYTYLVNDHYSPDAALPIGEPCRRNPRHQLADSAGAAPNCRRRTAPRPAWPRSSPFRRARPWSSAPAGNWATLCARRTLTRLTSSSPNVPTSISPPVILVRVRPWRDYDTIINAAAYTAVDAAETAEGRVAAWATNVTGVAALARVAADHGITLVHISSDYVFDGTATRPYREDDAGGPARRIRTDEGCR